MTLNSCKKENDNSKEAEQQIEEKITPKLFSKLTSKDTNISFQNELTENLDFNYFQYMYSYIGAGIASGDFDNDGLVDLFFVSNSGTCKLYKNSGAFVFEDMSKTAKIGLSKAFNTGVTIVDINQDGLLDIYLVRGGLDYSDKKFENLLYINEGNFKFSEQAAAYGLNDSNRGIQATFFDMDNDNDLDLFISNTPDIDGKTKDIINLNQKHKDPNSQHMLGSDKLYKNLGNGKFKDVSAKSGILYDIGFGLNPQVGDINNDGWLDIYVCNDFKIPDFVYLNNKNGTFTESKEKVLKHMSFNSMGSDFADINNDGHLDLMTLDMNPEDYIRSKTTMGMTSISQFEKMTANGYHNQYMHNMLQLNNGNGTFSEISKMANIGDTDWSWSLLSADFDLDGLNDIYVTNGVYRDVLDRDTNNEILKILRANRRRPTKDDFLKFAKMMPQQKLNNYFFKNKGDLTFEDTSTLWTDYNPTFSNGAIYADLDNDGDLDIVVNNINDEATILKNNATDINLGQFLKVKLKGPKNNNNGLGATIKLYQSDGTIQIRQLVNTRGFLSSVSNTLHFGIQKDATINNIEVKWLDGKYQRITDIKTNTFLNISYKDAEVNTQKSKSDSKKIFTKLTSKYKHEDPYFNDYKLQVLLPHKLSQTGPAVAKGDVNNDGIEDVYIGGGTRQAGQLLLGQKNGTLKQQFNTVFKTDNTYEDQGASFFDADNDGDLDLYVVSGSYEVYRTPKLLQDRLYINDGKGMFSISKTALPEFFSSGSVVAPSDFDGDGDIDLFVGGRVIPGKYPHPATSYILKNNNGSFSIETSKIAPDLEEIGLVTSAVWTDIDNDNTQDLIVTGEWMGINVFLNKDGVLQKSNAYKTLNESLGWWNKILVQDIDSDGDMDIIAGNLGLNYKFHASQEKPFKIYTTDFDYNGTQDIILAKDYKGKEVPVRGKGCMTQQIPHLSQKIPNYNDFANRNLEGILGKDLNNALHYKATEFRSGIFINEGNSKFTFSPFENHVQKSPINSILFEDINYDGFKDLILAGNNYQSEVETTRADAGIGSVLLGDNNGGFKKLSSLESGFFVDKDVRNMVVLDSEYGKLLLVINNNDTHDLFSIRNTSKK